jgi:hypothetical protein
MLQTDTPLSASDSGNGDAERIDPQRGGSR